MTYPKTGTEYLELLPSNWLLNMWVDRMAYAGLNMYFFPMQAMVMGDQPKFWIDTAMDSLVCRPSTKAS